MTQSNEDRFARRVEIIKDIKARMIADCYTAKLVRKVLCLYCDNIIQYNKDEIGYLLPLQCPKCKNVANYQL